MGEGQTRLLISDYRRQSMEADLRSPLLTLTPAEESNGRLDKAELVSNLKS